ncbi:HAD-like protein [Peniophora sp. CONT]|nr:HAD-like protein [Peniophora sp. CONT]
MSGALPCTTLIFDIGDVLFSWSPVTSTSIKPKQLKSILNSPTWHAYECGALDEQECYAKIGAQFLLDPAEVQQAFADARASLQPDDTFLSFIRELQAETGNTLRIFAMSNISAPDYEVLRTKPADWGIFERVFTSAAAGQRKPNLGFYRYVLSETNTDASRAVFIDDKPDNVLAARACGLNAIVFDQPTEVRRALRNYVLEPTARAHSFLNSRAGEHDSFTDTGITIGDNFCQLLILEATRDRSLVRYMQHPTKWNFFREKPMLTTDTFPCDLDTTSIGLMVTQPAPDVFARVMDEMLTYRTDEGIVLTYFDPERPRVDPVVCCNVLSLFYSQGRGADVSVTLDFVAAVLEHRAYDDGTRYYEGAEPFLFFLSRLLKLNNDAALHARLDTLFAARVAERIGTSGDALALAMRILACAQAGIRDEVDMRTLRMMQEEDGGWPSGWFYNY